MALTPVGVVITDTETSGLEPGHHEVIEIASILTDMNLEEKERYHIKVPMQHPERAEKRALEINKYDPVIWEKEGRPFYYWMDWIKKKSGYGRCLIFAGHNAQFDYRMIREGYYKPQGIFCNLSYWNFDTMGLAGILEMAGMVSFPDGYKLENVCKALGVKLDNAHNAMADCEATYGVLKKMIELMHLGRVL